MLVIVSQYQIARILSSPGFDRLISFSYQEANNDYQVHYVKKLDADSKLFTPFPKGEILLQVEHNLALNVFKLDHNGEPILEAPIKVPQADRAALGGGEVPHIHAQVEGIGIHIALDLFSRG